MGQSKPKTKAVGVTSLVHVSLLWITVSLCRDNVVITSFISQVIAKKDETKVIFLWRHTDLHTNTPRAVISLPF